MEFGPGSSGTVECVYSSGGLSLVGLGFEGGRAAEVASLAEVSVRVLGRLRLMIRIRLGLGRRRLLACNLILRPRGR